MRHNRSGNSLDSGTIYVVIVDNIIAQRITNNQQLITNN